MNLSGAQVLVTGATGGLGRALVQAFIREGAHVIAHGREEEPTRVAAEEMMAEPVWGDLAEQTGVAAVIEAVRQKTDILHALVHNAGVKGSGSIETVDRDTLQRALAVNALAPILLTQGVIDLLRAAGSSRVVLISSKRAQLMMGPHGGSLAYRISKTAANAFVVNAAAELQPDGVLVNAIDPGWVQTRMGGPDAPLRPEEAAEAIVDLVKLPHDSVTGAFFHRNLQLAW